MSPSAIAETYTAFGLTISSELSLPELAPAPPDATPDVVVRHGPVPFDNPGGEHLTYESRDDGCTIHNDDCIMWLRDGREIVVEPAPEADDVTVRWCLLGAGFNFILHQRGHLVLHGSLVGVDGAGVGFLGNSGAGKSTTAAAFLAAGHDLLADDVVAVSFGDDGPRVAPGFAATKLTRTAVDALGLPSANLDARAPSDEKAFFRSERRIGESVPLRRLYLLEDGDELGLDTLSPGESTVTLAHNTYTVAAFGDESEATANLGQCAALAGELPVCRLTRPRTFESLPALVERVEADLRGDGLARDTPTEQSVEDAP